MRNKYVLRVILLIAIIACTPARCARILGVFPFRCEKPLHPGKCPDEGSGRGGPRCDDDQPTRGENPPQNGSYRDVVLTGFVEDFNDLLKRLNHFEQKQKTIFSRIFIGSMLASITDRTFGHTNVQALLNSGEKFDVVIVEQFVNDTMKIFAHHFNAPLIIFSSIGPNNWLNRIVGNPSPSSYIPHMLVGGSSNMTFFPKS
ncbi:hypothetical protein NQ318_011376 [Aromia moschata]|uniref:Glucuronosyltransferase n=1 Tax=Aromia moschata TaxID=1265417 RepID=A0AAV8YT90_9CUCU|nr:hypothetical protein NQ318_011376 [Aromia moschata]